MSMLDLGEKLLKRPAGTCACGFDGLILLVSEDASSSKLEWRSNLLTLASGDGDGVSGDGDAAFVSSCHGCIDVVFVSVLMINGGTPLLAPEVSFAAKALTFPILGD
jgi:hypothetical protein